MIDKRWFQDRIRDAGISQADLARQLEIDRSALSLMLSGKRSMKLEEAAGIAGVLSLDVDDVLARAGVRLPSSASSSADILPELELKEAQSILVGEGRLHERDSTLEDLLLPATLPVYRRRL